MNYLRYSPDIEQPDRNENEAIDSIIAAMTRQSQRVAKREGRAVRASHAKSTGLVTGELTVADSLPEELAQGLFSRTGRYDVAVRLAQGAGEILPDDISVHRGMAIKVFGVAGKKINGHDADTQDFVLASGPVFPAGTAQGFLSDEKKLEHAPRMPDAAKSAVSSVARNVNRAAKTLGSDIPVADFFGHPYSHPLAEPYFSQAPMRYGDYVAKIGVFAAEPKLGSLKQDRIDTSDDDNAFRTAVVDYFAKHGARFELRVQLWTNADTQPIEDASLEWPQDESPFRTVAWLDIPAQDAYSPARQRYFDERMTFAPAHALAAHQPLGSVMRARLKVYAALAQYRHRENDTTPDNPSDSDDIPE